MHFAARNLRSRSIDLLAQLGVHTLEQLKQADAVELYVRLRALWPGTSLNMLYALIGAQEDLPWQTIKRERRTELLLRLDEIGQAPP